MNVLQTLNKSLHLKNYVEAVKNKIDQHLQGSFSISQEMIDYLSEFSGKMLRPILLAISASYDTQSNSKKEEILNASLAIELVHIATLIHDDIIDNAPLRRNKPTYHEKWDNTKSILFGDYLFTKAFELIASLGNIDIINILTSTVSKVCEGEIEEQNNTKKDILIADYYKIINFKTASLMAATCQIGAYWSFPDSDGETIRSHLYQFGLNLGMAFQIFDDYLDFYGKESILGKPTFQDMMNGNYTLPVVHLLEHEDESLKQSFFEHLNAPLTSDKETKIRLLLEKSGSISFCLHQAQRFIQQAKESLQPIDNEQMRYHLSSIADFVIERKK